MNKDKAGTVKCNLSPASQAFVILKGQSISLHWHCLVAAKRWSGKKSMFLGCYICRWKLGCTQCRQCTDFVPVGEEIVTKECFISVCWRLIPYVLNNWEKQWGAECSSMMFELPHFAVELLVILPIVQVLHPWQCQPFLSSCHCSAQ